MALDFYFHTAPSVLAAAATDRKLREFQQQAEAWGTVLGQWAIGGLPDWFTRFEWGDGPTPDRRPGGRHDQNFAPVSDAVMMLCPYPNCYWGYASPPLTFTADVPLAEACSAMMRAHADALRA